jgi:hypothetical protein
VHSSEAAASLDATVTVRTYNYAQIPRARLANARVTVDAIFKGAKIALEWIDCRVPQSGGASCTDPLRTGRELMLRLMDQPHEPAYSRRVLTLGTSMLDLEQGGGVLMTIDLFPIRTIAEQASTDFPTLLGRAIAHEIGHLLLGTAQHPREGLMRARWLQDELRGLKPAHWEFSPREAADMRHGLAIKARTSN